MIKEESPVENSNTDGSLPRYPVVVLGNSSTNSLGVIRAFGRKGLPVYFTTNAGDHATSHLSRYVRSRVVIREWEGEALLHSLLPLAAKLSHFGKIVVFPTSDAALLAYCTIKPRLPAIVVDCVPARPVMELCIYKDRFSRWLAAQGIPHPRTLELNLAHPALDQLPDSFNFPLALKPVQSHLFQQKFDGKLLVARDAGEFEHDFELARAAGQEMLAQEIIPGGQIYQVCCYISRSGAVAAAAGFRKIRQMPHEFGTGSLIENHWDETLVGQALDVLRQLGFTGIGEVELIFEPRTQRHLVLEVNVRSVTYNRLPAYLGVDLERLYYLEAVGALPLNGLLKPEARPIRWADLGKDLPTILRLRREKRMTLSRALRSFRGLRVTGHFALDDWKPFLAEVSFQSLAALRKLLNGKQSRRRSQKQPPASSPPSVTSPTSPRRGFPPR